MNEYSTYIRPEYTSEYQKYHRAICIDLNRMIWNISFLKKAIEAQEIGAPYRNSFIIEHLFKNEYELLILRFCRSILDEGSDTMTILHLKNKLLSTYLSPSGKEELESRLQNCTWKSPEIDAALRRVKTTAHTFRTNFIAHSLKHNIEEMTISYLDIEKIVVAACDLLLRLSFDTDSFYQGFDRCLLNFSDEIFSTEKFLSNFFAYQQTSAWCIERIECHYKEDEYADTVSKHIEHINSLFLT